jgi:hypothetical protein
MRFWDRITPRGRTFARARFLIRLGATAPAGRCRAILPQPLRPSNNAALRYSPIATAGVHSVAANLGMAKAANDVIVELAPR